MGKKSILLVPEISLTPQMVSQVAARFGDRVAVIHSHLTQKQRFEQWKRIRENEVDVVVGARSAIFAPFDNIGLIIVDEEHENTYVSEFSPKYNAIEIAKFRARQFSSVLLLASATPLVESMFRAQNGKYKLLNMKNRVNSAFLPTTEIVDMRVEMNDGNMSIFSQRLMEEISLNLERGEQTILFLNRRGFSSFVSCRNCGYTPQCPNCNVSLTYHKSINKMICHYCDYAHPVYTLCPECGSKHIRHFGIGTQKVAEEIKSIFPKVRITRMDADTTSARYSHERLLESFKNHESDILIGTQMITKGLDFENVTLVGIIAADMSLNVDDYRAAERTFDLVTQVTGRAGRGALEGRAIIQTYNPENESIMAAARQDYYAFYNEEIELRKILVYPPFCEFVNFIFTSEEKRVAERTAKEFKTALEKVTTSREAIFYPVGEAPLFRLNGRYRYRFLIKTRYSKELYNKIAELYSKISKKKASSQISIDVNPTNMY
jgi:primosomal protein N' (replication factor Y)